MTQHGRDISVWQGTYGFPAVDFTIAKATEGIGYRDPQWTRNQRILLQPGSMVGGSYHFFRGNPNEVDWYLSQHDHAVFLPSTPWIFVLDAEAEGDANAVNQFLARLKAAIGFKPWFYSYGAWIQARPGIDRSYPLWIAAPSSPMGQPPAYGWPAVTAHQYGTVDGVDANVFLGDRGALLKLAGVGASPSEEVQDVSSVVQGNRPTDPVYNVEGNTKFQLTHPVQLAFYLKRAKQDRVWRPGDEGFVLYDIDRVPAVPFIPEDISGTSLKSYNDTPWPLPKATQAPPAQARAGAEPVEPPVPYDDPRWQWTAEEAQQAAEAEAQKR